MESPDASRGVCRQAGPAQPAPTEIRLCREVDTAPATATHGDTMDTTPIQPPTLPPTRRGPFDGAKRSIAMALLAVGLLVVGGSAVAFAADPSPSEAPAATTTPTTGTDAGGGTAP